MTNKQLFIELRKFNWSVETIMFEENALRPFIKALVKDTGQEFTEKQEGLIKAYYVSKLLENTYVLG